MVKILFLATRPQAIEQVKTLLPPGVQLRTAMLSSGSTIMFDTAFSPDVIIVHVENVNRQRLFGVMDLREDDAYKYLPMLIIGDEKDQDVFNQNVRPGADKRVNPENGLDAVKKAITEIIDLRTIEEKHVLVVDDDPVMLKTLRTYLEDSFTVTAVKSGKLAIKFLEKQTPDIILLDYMMPDWDGATTYQLIRGRENGKRVPIVFLTGINDKDKVMECLSLRPQGYLVKPVNKPDVIAKIKELV